MNFDEVLLARRAVRSYTPRRVAADLVGRLLDAAVQAPSAMNRQPWLFAIVQDPARLKRYSDRAKTMLLPQLAADPKAKHYEDLLGSDAFNVFYDAGTLIVIGAEPSPYADADCWLAAENLMLAACAAGLGTCCIGFAVGVLNTPEVKAELGLPASARAVAPVIVGHPAGVAAPVARHEPKIVGWIT